MGQIHQTRQQEGEQMSLYRSLLRAGVPPGLCRMLVMQEGWDETSLRDLPQNPDVVKDSTGVDYLRWWYENSTLSRAHMEFLFEIINYIKYNRAKYELYKKIGRNRSYSYKYTLAETQYDSDFIQELNAIARKMSHARDPSPLINYTRPLFLNVYEFISRYSDAEFSMMTNNIRQHLIEEPLYLLSSKQINQREAGILDKYLQEYPFWAFGELYPITSLNYPKAFK